MDLLIPGQTPGIKEPLVDLYGKPELLFFGPDGMWFLSGFLGWWLILCWVDRGYSWYDGLGCPYVLLCLRSVNLWIINPLIVHARTRGAETWWKSFTTGKSAETLGGVPHDTYGMTSLSIRQYVLGIYKQLGLREKDITKVQTGGPGMFYPHWKRKTTDFYFSDV